ncbi:MAG: hypothetical protein PHP59_08955 [Methanofollis sp.]|uniref:COG1361 S-layer family protein n=1 Tax=Methanofollis sp. TaxID=2052835 RepID=UPI00260DC043|nr:hypothetical protein [Methanofollis sp.]MDD4255488.1 hypothetical protein [Methanofollis sp.]
MREVFFTGAFLLLLLAGAAAAATPEEDAAQVMVTGAVIDPAVLMPGDVATVTVTVKNTAQVSVPVRSAKMYTEGNILVLDNPYQTFGAIGAGNEASFTFTVQADAGSGTYYPRFVLDFTNAGSLRYAVPVKVEAVEPRVSVADIPDAFTAGKKDIVRVTVSNPRSGEVNGVSVMPSGEGLVSVPTSAFIGALAPDGSAEVAFNITPESETTLTMTVTYRNGRNQRTTEVSIPIVFSEDKKSARIVVSGVDVTTENGSYRVSGDVTNAGLEVAKAVVVTVGSPGVPVDPNRVYPVASLDPDDLSNFELTFRAENVTEVPLVIEYRDTNGNLYTTRTNISVEGTALPGEGEEGGSLPLTVVLLIVAALAVVGAVIFFSWRRAKGG